MREVGAFHAQMKMEVGDFSFNDVCLLLPFETAYRTVIISDIIEFVNEVIR